MKYFKAKNVHEKIKTFDKILQNQKCRMVC